MELTLCELLNNASMLLSKLALVNVSNTDSVRNGLMACRSLKTK